MILGDMVSRVRRQLPSATVEAITDNEIWGELNRGVDECNRYTQVYKTYTEFSLVVGQQIYPLSTNVPTYLDISKNGVWYNSNTAASPTWKELVPKTIRWLDLFIRNWRDLTSAEPYWYWVEGDDLGLYPKPNAVKTVRVYHLKKATPMDNSSNYPWTNTTTEITALRPLDDAIIAYARFKLATAVGQNVQTNPLREEFLFEIKRAQTQIRRRPDISSHWDSWMRIDALP